MAGLGGTGLGGVDLSPHMDAGAAVACVTAELISNTSQSVSMRMMASDKRFI